jgi:hypothetical protein
VIARICVPRELPGSLGGVTGGVDPEPDEFELRLVPWHPVIADAATDRSSMRSPSRT